MRAIVRRESQRVPAHAFAIIAAATIGLPGCGRAESVSSVIRSDSAGIMIVESATAQWDEGREWRLDGPTVSIGSVDGPPDTQLHRVRAVSLLPDGRIAIANGGTAEIRLYDAEGRWIRSLGREGAGPGEFRVITGLQVIPPDTLVVFENGEGRVAIFTAEGALVTSRRIVAPGETFQGPEHRLKDGRWLNLMHSTEVEGYQKRRNSFVAWSDSASPGDTILSRDGQEYLIYIRHQNGQYIGRGAVGYPFAGQDVGAFRDGRMALSSGLAFDVAVVEMGRGKMRIRRRMERPPLAPDRVARFVDDYVGRYPPQRQSEVRGHFARLPVPDAAPTHSALQFDPAGSLWIENYRRPWDSLATRNWSVFEPTGSWLGDVEFPRGLRVFEIGDNHVVGVERDSDGVEFVRLYRITR